MTHWDKAYAYVPPSRPFLLLMAIKNKFPAPIRYHLMKLIYVVRPYVSEFLYALFVLAVMVYGCLRDPKNAKETCSGVFELAEPDLPSGFGFYRYWERKYYAFCDLLRNQSIFGPVPSEAGRLFNAKPGPLPPPHSGLIRIQLFTDFQRGRYKTNGADESDPDAWLDMRVDSVKGVDLSMVRKTWGLETVAVITDGPPLRLVFEAAEDDWLSRLAVYNLSKGYARPLRVFEPRISPVTKNVRNVRHIVYPTVLFAVTLLKLVIGFPEKDTTSLRAVIGERYANAYQSAGKITSSVPAIIAGGAQLIRKGFLPSLFLLIAFLKLAFGFPERDTNSMMQLIGMRRTRAYLQAGSVTLRARLLLMKGVQMFLAAGCMGLILPFGIIYISASTGYRLVIRAFRKIATAARGAAQFAGSLDTLTWFIIFALCWFCAAEYHSRI